MNVPAPPLKGLTGTAVQVPGVPGTGGGPVVGPVLGVGEVVRLGVGDGDGLEVRLGLALGLGPAVVRDGVGDDAVEPLQVVPLKVKLAGAGLLELFQLALKPNEAVPLVATAPL